MKTAKKQADGDLKILQDSELETLREQTNFKSLYETQRFNMVLISFRTGLRPQTLEHVQFNMLRIFEEEGQEKISFLIPHMKNHQPTVQNAKKPPVEFIFHKHSDPRCVHFFGRDAHNVFSSIGSAS